jgi:SAM-dependent methyltransferase/uncharacterized protein YbaR (Trm112 family)
MNPWLRENLVCPKGHSFLALRDGKLFCAKGHSYPCVDGIPILLVEEAEPTHMECSRTLDSASLAPNVSEADPAGTEPARGAVDPYVQKIIAGTCGIMYLPLIGKLSRYPILGLRLLQGRGEVLVEIGCNWCRLCVSAERKGYHLVRIDPSLEAILAARRVARDLNASMDYLVADARYLPFADHSADIVFSYSVLQHFAKGEARTALQEVARVLKPSGFSLIQMPNIFGLVNLAFQAVRFGRRIREFDIRYWSPSELKKTFSACIGLTTVSVDGYFSLNSQISDVELLPLRYKAVVILSDFLRKKSERLPWMQLFADSLYLRSTSVARD